jgi:glycosyltransferase involved in cell wall biosynthesis
MTRIAYLLHNFPGKTDTFIKREIRSLEKLGAEITVVSVWRPKNSQTTPEILTEWANSTCFLLPKSVPAIGVAILSTLLRNPFLFFKTFIFALCTSKSGFKGTLYQIFYFAEAVLACDVIRSKKISHIHNHIGDQSGTVTMLAAQLAGVEYSITFHGWPVFFDAKESRIKEKVRGAKFVRAISYFCRSQLMMFSEMDDVAPFKVVHCGLEMRKYMFRPPGETVRTLFCAARLSPEKGLSFLLRAIAELASRGFDLRLRLAGSGPSDSHLKALVSYLNITDRVDFLGFLDEDGIILELQRSDLFVLPSFVEGLPVSAIEAMAIGVPVVATNIAGTGELVESGITGTLIRPSDVEDLVRAIEAVVKDYDFRLRSTRQGREKVESEFDVDKEAVKFYSHLFDAVPDSNHLLGSV